MNQSTRPNAFTLVEMLVVVAIIALLLAILLPSMQKARYKARLVVCASQVRQIVAGSMTYATDFQGFFPSSTLVKSGTTQKYRARVTEIPGTLASYTGGTANPIKGNYNNGTTLDPNKNPLWQCPEADSRSLALGAKPGSYYALYYNSVSSLYSGINVPVSYDADGAEPMVPAETMQRINEPRIFKSWRWSGESINGWKSTIIASDLAYSTHGTEAGHMIGGEYHKTPYSALTYASYDAVCTANYGFQDGSVREYSFTDATVFGDASTPPTMARALGGPFDWDNYVLPRDALKPYP